MQWRTKRVVLILRAALDISRQRTWMSAGFSLGHYFVLERSMLLKARNVSLESQQPGWYNEDWREMARFLCLLASVWKAWQMTDDGKQYVWTIPRSMRALQRCADSWILSPIRSGRWILIYPHSYAVSDLQSVRIYSCLPPCESSISCHQSL